MIAAIFRATLSLGSLGLAVPCATFFAECLFGSIGRKKSAPSARHDGTRVAVLIPAHNESLGITLTLRRLLGQLQADDQVLVIADNCTDDTAALARLAGATVLERTDAERRGKGYALSHGVEHLAAAEVPPDVVVVLDADCRLNDGGVDALASTAMRSMRPVQADNVLLAPPDSSIKTRIGVFAFRVKNRVRPRGLQRMGFPRQLAGTGMAFPWAVLRDAPSMQGHITEDLVLGLELAMRGQATIHCAEAMVESDIAPSSTGQAGQRARWEHGHLAAIREYLPNLVRESIRQRRLELLALSCDLAVPSLAILVIVVGGSFVATGVIAAIAPSVGWLPLAIVAADAALVGCGVAASYCCCGRDLLSVKDLLVGVPQYVLWKVPSYLRLLRRKRTTEWIRAER